MDLYRISDYELVASIQISDVLQRFEFIGGQITNIIRYCVLQSLERGEKKILIEDMKQAIVREFRKKGKILV